MRVVKFLKEKNIGISTLNDAAEYLHIGRFTINSKLDDETINSINPILSESDFLEWRHAKTIYLKTKFDKALKLIEFFKVGTVNCSETHCKRILNAIIHLTNTGYYNSENKSFILEVINSDYSINEKVSKINQYILKKQEEKKPKRIVRESSHDPYEGFEWGGLSGEEAHTAYWNCD
tara:strand:- start:423 stop:953 length:531 start_codon:yes stop_codon:yes gene_type:complete